LALVALAGAALAWAGVLAVDGPLRAGLAATARQDRLAQAVGAARALAPAAPELLLLAPVAEEAPFVRYLAYPLPVRELTRRPRPGSAPEALPAGGLLLVAARGGDEPPEAALQLATRGAPRRELRELARAGADIVLYEVLP
jgi:hypothetical protein